MEETSEAGEREATYQGKRGSEMEVRAIGGQWKWREGKRGLWQMRERGRSEIRKSSEIEERAVEEERELRVIEKRKGGQRDE